LVYLKKKKHKKALTFDAFNFPGPYLKHHVHPEMILDFRNTLKYLELFL